LLHQGASTTCYVALHPEVKGLSGEYFADNKIAKVGSRGRDIELAKKLWDFSMNLIKWKLCVVPMLTRVHISALKRFEFMLKNWMHEERGTRKQHICHYF